LPALDRVEQDLGGLLDAFEERVVVRTAGGGLLIGVVAEDLSAVSPLDLFFRGAVAVFGETEDGVVILSLEGKGEMSAKGVWRGRMEGCVYLPVFGVPLKHQGVLWLADLAAVVVFDLFDVFLGLYSLVFGKGAVMSFLSGNQLKRP
jgi:hypothetical protein